MTRQLAFHDAMQPFAPRDPRDADEVQIVPRPPEARLPSYIADHRRRLRDRFMAGGAAALPDYEMLELVLFRAIRGRTSNRSRGC